MASSGSSGSSAAFAAADRAAAAAADRAGPGSLSRLSARAASVEDPDPLAAYRHGMAKQLMDRSKLARAWDISQRTTADDWRDYMRTFSLSLLEQSPSAALRYCSLIAARSLPLRVELVLALDFERRDGLGVRGLD